MLKKPLSLFAALLATIGCASAQVIINEIHYHPVENPAFDANGNPIYQGTATIADFSDDVHEFLEIYNPTASPVDISGWRLTGGVEYTFPNGTSIPATGYKVVAKNPARIQTVYSISGVLGPYGGKLSNSGDTVRLVTPANVVSDAVSYDVNFPWAISANALGADDDFSGLSSASYQYKGRSLQRVSATAASSDPANWVAVRTTVGGGSFADLPTPGAVNIVTRAVPKPVVVQRSATLADNTPIIRSNQAVKISATFSAPVTSGVVQVEYFLEDLTTFSETRLTGAMTLGADGKYTATLPGRPDRSIVRWRIKANLGDGVEVVSPRADDPAVVQMGAPSYPSSPAAPSALPKIPAPREPWLTYFVTPVRSSAKPILDIIVSTNGGAAAAFNGLNGIEGMSFDCGSDPKRTTGQGTASSYPRETPYVLSSAPIWDDVVPAVFASNGVAYDIQIRRHGSRYNRGPNRNSFKVFFPEYQPYTDGSGTPVTSIFETDKNDHFLTAHGLYQLAGLPLSTVRYVDLYFNSLVLTAVEQGEYNSELLDAYHEKRQRLNPGSAKEETGEYYKSTGFISSPNTSGEGPYGNGNGWRLPAAGFWTELQRFTYTFALQGHQWKGNAQLRNFVNGMWTARGDNITDTGTLTSNPNIPNTTAWFNANWDVDTELTALALANWMAPWDDTTQNHYYWHRLIGTGTNGRWVRLLWDFDGMYGTGDSTSSSSSIYHGEVNGANNSRGPNFVVDSFLKCFRPQFNQRLWELNNTLLDPENLQTIAYKNGSGTLVSYYSWINAQGGGFAQNRFISVNSQVGLGTFYKPARPTNFSPGTGSAALPPANLAATPYVYNAAVTHTAAPVTKVHTKSKWEIRLSTGDYDHPVFGLTTTSNLTSLPVPFDQLTYGQTYFWRVTYYDSDGHPSITSAETFFSYGPTSTSAGNVTINEVMADNLSAVANGVDHPDYIELKNTTASAINITGWTLTDDELVPAKYTFPATTTLLPNSYLVVWCDSNSASPGLHSGFQLSRKGQRVLLLQSNVVKDAIAFGPQITNGAIGRFADGTGAWTLVNASPGAANTARTFSSTASLLKFNEWMAVPASGDDWFEIYNPGTDPVALAGLWLSDTPATPKITQIPALSFVGAKSCVRFDADGSTKGFSSANFKLSTGGDNLLLTSSDGYTTNHSVSFGVQQSGVSQGYFPDGSGTLTFFPYSNSPGDNNWLPATSFTISEALTNSVAPLEDYVEIQNTTGSPLDISGWWLSDDHFVRQKFQIPASTIIPANGFVVITESQFNVGANAFSLSSLGDEIILSEAPGGVETGNRSQFNFGAAADNVAFGRVATAGAPEFWPQVARTSGAVNSAPLIGPVIINEVHYHPPDLSAADNVRDEFVELHNITTSPVDIGGWKLKGASDFTFAGGTILRPGDYILVVGFNPATDATSLSGFRAALSVPVSVPIYGPFTPKLANDTANVELGYPGTPVGGVTPYINVDKVEYLDFAPWPTTPDGNGPSLQRISRSIIGNDAANFIAATPTPGAVNSGQSAILDNDGDGMPNAWEDLYGLDKFNGADGALDLDGDGQSNVSEYLAGTAPNNPADALVATATRTAGGLFKVSFQAKAGKGYTIQFKNLITDALWQKLTDIAAPGANGLIEFTDPATGLSKRFYRVITPQQP